MELTLDQVMRVICPGKDNHTILNPHSKCEKLALAILRIGPAVERGE